MLCFKACASKALGSSALMTANAACALQPAGRLRLREAWDRHDRDSMTLQS